MKIILITFLSLYTAVSIFSQDFRKGPDPQKRINQLEKVKIIEELELDDQTAVQFFNLRDQHHQKMMTLRERSDKLLDELQETLSSGESKKGSSLNKIVEDIEANEDEIFKLRKTFLNDAENILTPEKYAKYLVFERNFREEMRKIVMKERMNRRKKP